MEVKEITSPSQYAEFRMKRIISLEPDSDKRNRAEALIPQVRQANRQLLEKKGISLGKLESDGYCVENSQGGLTVLSIDNGDGLLVASSLSDLQRSEQDFSFTPRKFPVLNGSVNPRVYLDFDKTNNTWSLVDQRDGTSKKTEFTYTRTETVARGSTTISLEYRGVAFDGHHINMPETCQAGNIIDIGASKVVKYDGVVSSIVSH